MKENRIRKALMQVCPGEDAQDRIYQNVMKKASGASGRGKRLSWILIPLAACFLLVVGLLLPKPSAPPQRPPVAVSSPMQQVEGPEGLSPAGVWLDAPEDARDVRYYLINGQVAKLCFTLGENEYEYLASARREDNFSFVPDGEDPEVIQGLHRSLLSRSPEGRWKGQVELHGAKAYILGSSEAPRAEMEQLLRSFTLEILK